MGRLIGVMATLLVLVGCGQRAVEDTEIRDMGEFRLAHNIVIASKMQMVPGSREATEEEWIASLTQAFEERFGRYEGEQLYHFGISVEGYMLAPPGVPLVASPKSAVVLNITIWDDAETAKINEEPHQMVIFEAFGEGAVVGSGLANTREEQLANLAFNASRQLEIWLSRQHQQFGWFDAKASLEDETLLLDEDGNPLPPEEANALEDNPVDPEVTDVVPMEELLEDSDLPLDEDEAASFDTNLETVVEGALEEG